MSAVLEARALSREYAVSRGLFGGSASVKALAGVSFSLSAGRTLAGLADREPADDRAEMAAALGQVAFFRSNIRMETDRREIHVVSRAACIDPNGHQPVADQALGSNQQRIHRLRAVR